jgi:general secretion pathway protein C
MTNQLTALMARTAALQKVNQRLPMIVSLLLVIACAHALAKITWMFVPEEDAPMVTTAKPAAPVNNAAVRQQAIRQLTSAHLFGIADQPATAKQTSAPKTKLNLVLRGVVAAEPMEMSFAIIARGKKGKEEAFGVGDKIPGGVTIEEIHADRIILSRNGRLETLFMVKDEDLATLSNGRPVTSSRPPGKPQGLADVRQSLLKNPTSFGDYAIPVIVKENGKQVGYRLQPQSMGEELMAQIGMNASDVITEINGVRLDKPQNGVAALRKLSTAKSITLKVKRNGAEVPLNIQLQ